MPISGDFRSKTGSMFLLDEPWFPKRLDLELGAICNADIPRIQFLDICESSLFPIRNYLALQLLMGSRRMGDVSYACEIILPTQWPFAEPISRVQEITTDLQIGGHSLPHIYTERPFQHVPCTHVDWDCRYGRSTIAAFLFALHVWLSTLEEWLDKEGSINWSEYARSIS